MDNKHYNFVFLDENSKREIRRCLLKAVAIPGYQVPFGSRELPKINTVAVIYNGDTKAFDTFIESMINDYLNSDSMPKCSDSDFIDKVEIIDKTA